MTLFKQSALAAAVCLALAPAAFAQQTSGSSTTPAADTGATTSSTAATPSSDEVRQVQQHLKDKGVDVAVDGVMGPKTRAALKSFQQQQGLTASGDIDSSTLTALGVQGGGSTMDSSSPAGAGSSSTSPSSGSGSTGASPSDSGSATMPKK